MSAQKSALFVCLGNICRSPMAEAVFKHIVNQRGEAANWKIDSAGLGGWHSGSSPDHRACKTLEKYNVKCENIARQIEDEDYDNFDYIFGMDENNIKNLKAQAPKGSKAQILLLGDFDPQGDRIIRDPYYDNDSNGFEKCYEQCLRSCTAFLDSLKK